MLWHAMNVSWCARAFSVILKQIPPKQKDPGGRVAAHTKIQPLQIGAFFVVR